MHTIYPADSRLPMVAPRDLGLMAARRLTSGREDGVATIEAPGRPSWDDVAAAFGKALDCEIHVVSIRRRGDWIEAFKAQGFSAAAADAYARMTAIAPDGPIPPQSETIKGEVTLDAYIEALVNKQMPARNDPARGSPLQ